MFFGSPEHLKILIYEALSPQRQYALCFVFFFFFYGNKLNWIEENMKSPGTGNKMA